MDPIEELKKLLTESVGDDESTKIVESLENYKKKVQEDADASVDAKVQEAIKDEKVKLEESYITQLEEDKTKSAEAVKQEITVFEQRLAKRVKTMLEQALDRHGDRLFTLEEQAQSAQAKSLVEQLEGMLASAKGTVAEGADGGDIKTVKELKDRVKVLEGEVEKHKKDAIRARARANVAESEVKELKESIDTGISVTIDEGEQEQRIAESQAGGHKDSKGGKTNIHEGSDGNRNFSPEMKRMRQIAGIETK